MENRGGKRGGFDLRRREFELGSCGWRLKKECALAEKGKMVVSLAGQRCKVAWWSVWGELALARRLGTCARVLGPSESPLKALAARAARVEGIGG